MCCVFTLHSFILGVIFCTVRPTVSKTDNENIMKKQLLVRARLQIVN
jgi:hypothetical protein